MAYGTIYSDTIQGSTANTAPVFKDGNSVEIGQFVKSWFNYNGSTPAVGASFNVSSITRTGTGQYYSTCSTSMADSNLCPTHAYIPIELIAASPWPYCMDIVSLTSSVVTFETGKNTSGSSYYYNLTGIYVHVTR